ncbi:MAG: FdtA/QdtA family cupin domain-containing protein [Bacteroidetes bacterium]|nr:FdtA/QdtA family cupin domain-containing protein [Bacteroidota bacterium]
MNKNEPYLLEFSKIGASNLGYISVAEKQNLPFEVKRIYWTYFTPEDVQRGGHAHYELEQILIAVAGKIIIKTEMLDGKKQEFILEKPNIGLYIPQMCWRQMQYTHNAVQMCIASMEYAESDYIREYQEYLRYKK